MALSFGASFKTEFEKFLSVKNSKEFLTSIIPFIQFTTRFIDEKDHPYHQEVVNWRVVLFNAEQHILYDHQIVAIKGCFDSVVLSEEINSGYCFMPTSGGKGHILMVLAGLAVGNFEIQKLVSDTMPDIWQKYPQLFPILISLGLEYSKIIAKDGVPRTQILVHDIEILKQLENDCENILGIEIKSKIEFFSVQALSNPTRKLNLKYVIIDECHWGNASEEETVQSQLINAVKQSGGKAFGFTASPYTDGKFQKTWSNNRLNSNLDFNYYLDRGILYPITLREVNLQNARVAFEEGKEVEEIDLTEKEQVINFMADHIATTLPPEGLDGPAICYFSSIIIPDMVEALFQKRPDLKTMIKVLASDSAFFAKKCTEMFGSEVLANDNDVSRLKAGEKVFLISRQKLLVGLNAPLLRYCFISPTNSKIIIMQGIGRLMRPVGDNSFKKLATLFLTSLTGKKLSISGKGSDPKEKDNAHDEFDPNDHDNPKSRYTTISMTLSEAYDLPTPVFYKTEVGFRDFINQTRVKDGNTVEVLKRKFIDPEELDKFDPIHLRENLSRLRDMVRAQYKKFIMERDSRLVEGRRVWFCHGKDLLGDKGCNRSASEVNLEIHHMEPYTFASLYSKYDEDGILKWHADLENMKHLVTLCEGCHYLIHSEEESEKGAA